jgi:hypothetical protein
MKSKVDPQKAREQNAAAAFRAYANKRGLNKTFEQLDADAKEAWCEAADEVAAAILGTLDSEETFIALLKMAMRDALTEDHITQLQTQFSGRGGLPGKIRLIVAPDRMSMSFGGPLQGRHDG